MKSPGIPAIGRARLRLKEQDPDRGSVGLYIAIFMVALLAFAGLVLDGGAALNARGQAAALAQQAARAGADVLDPQVLRTGSTVNRIDAAAAVTAAQQVLSAAGATGSVTISTDAVTVTASVTVPAKLLKIAGVDVLAGTASATATLISGNQSGGR